MTAIHEITKSSRISYLDIHIDVDQNKCDDLKLCNMQLKMLIDNALLTLYGETGRNIVTEVIRCNSSARRAVIRISTDYVVKVSNSLTLCSSVMGISCAFRINKVSGHLMAFAELG